MPQSLVKNYIHITFSTKKRRPTIQNEIQENLFAYISGICNKLECHAEQVGGVEDHIHILCMLSKNITLATLLKEIKINSSKWVKTNGAAYQNFFWQTGYGAFSVNPKEIDLVKRYIQNQKEHHRNKNFQTEFLEFLNKYNVEYDERYLWE